MVPTSVVLPMMVRTSQSWATRCIQVPVLEMTWPVANSLKLRTFRELKVLRGDSERRSPEPVPRRLVAGAPEASWAVRTG